MDIFKVRRFTNLDGEVIEFGPAFGRRTVLEVPDDPLVPSLPSLQDLRLLERMRDDPKDREDLRYLDLLQAEGRSGKRRRR